MAKPRADSAAAIVKINKEKIWPYKSSKYIEKKIKFKFNESSNNSRPIKVIKKFLKFKMIPHNEKKNIIKVTKINSIYLSNIIISFEKQCIFTKLFDKFVNIWILLKEQFNISNESGKKSNEVNKLFLQSKSIKFIGR